MVSPLTELEEVTCRRPGCVHGYQVHDAAGGHCRDVISNSPAYRLPCLCWGFLWVAPDGPAVGSYLEPPTPV